MTEVRSLARRLRLTRLIQLIQGRQRNGYEEKVSAALRAAVREGDTVWDVGANVGWYTERLSDWVGAGGCVVAIEPVPSCFAALRKRVEGRENVVARCVGLGDADTELPMYLSDDPEAPSHNFLGPRPDTPNAVTIEVRTGDGLRRSESLPTPNVLKIDVEGFEPEVLRGLDATLRDPACRMVLCEVHFTLLESRGLRRAPAEIRRYFRERGFSLKWIDSGHLGAYRTAGA